MLIDDVTITVKGGDGGSGAVAFNKNMMSLGPVGGSGGNGGSVYAQAISDIGALRQFRNKKKFYAPNGGQGRGQFIDGSDGEDIVLSIPVGSVIHNLVTKEVIELLEAGQKVLLSHGGRGGKGNFHYRSSTNTSPQQSQPGKPVEKFRLRIELKLIADVGLIGLPNAGKSSLINELTRAQSRVANYPFTTLEPHLGSYYGLIIADIPGLIEGASEGKGLGDKFLRHVERTKVLFHLVSTESENISADYKKIRNELKAYKKELLLKKEYVFLSKTDMISQADAKKKLTALKKLNKNTLPISIHDWEALEKVKKILNSLSEKDKVKSKK